MPEYEKCWACVQIVKSYPGPVLMSALAEVQGQDIGLCDPHWSWWVAYWMSDETGDPGCSAHVVTLPPPLRPVAFMNSDGNGQVVTDDACPSCGYPERHRVYRGDSTELIADGCPACEVSRMVTQSTEPGTSDG